MLMSGSWLNCLHQIQGLFDSFSASYRMKNEKNLGDLDEQFCKSKNIVKQHTCLLKSLLNFDGLFLGSDIGPCTTSQQDSSVFILYLK